MDLQQLLSDASKAAYRNVVSVVYPYEHRTQLLESVPLSGSDKPDKYFILLAPYTPLHAFTVLEDLAPGRPMTTQWYRIFLAPDDWREVIKMPGNRLMRWTMKHTDEESTVLALQSAACALLSHPDDEELYVARDIACSRLAKIEAGYLLRRIANNRVSSDREAHAMSYMNYYWTMIASAHVQLAGTRWADIVDEEFQSAKKCVKSAMSCLNNRG